MSAGLYTHTTRATGTTLTAAIYNGDHVNHITNQTPQMTGAYSDTAVQMQTNTDPGGVGTESLAGSLAGELERLRFAIKRLAGGAQWYASPVTVTYSTSVITPLVSSAAANVTLAFLTNNLKIANSAAAAAPLEFQGSTSDAWRVQTGLLAAGDFGIRNATQAVNALIFAQGATPDATFTASLKVNSNLDADGSAVWGSGSPTFGEVVKRKTADENITSTTLQDDDHLTFSIAANEEWVASFYIQGTQPSGNSGLKMAVNSPSGATQQASAEAKATGNLQYGSSPTIGANIINLSSATFGNSPFAVLVQLWILNGATPGTVALQFAAGTGGGAGVTFLKGSYMRAIRIA